MQLQRKFYLPFVGGFRLTVLATFLGGLGLFMACLILLLICLAGRALAVLTALAKAEDLGGVKLVVDLRAVLTGVALAFGLP